MHITVCSVILELKDLYLMLIYMFEWMFLADAFCMFSGLKKADKSI